MGKSSKSSVLANADIDPQVAAYNALKTNYGNLGRKHIVKPVPRHLIMPTISVALDILTNEAGYRPGSNIEWYGLEGTMKSTNALAQCKIAQVFEPNKSIAYIDTEYSIDKFIAAKNQGIDMGEHANGIPKFDFYPDPDNDPIPTFEEVLDRIYNFAASGLFSLIVLDSVTATQTLYEQKADSVSTGQFAGPAVLMSKALKKVKAICAKTGTRVIYINQLRTAIIQTPRGPISKDEPGGGKALRYAATHRFKTTWTDKNKEGGISYMQIVADKVKYGPSWSNVLVPMRPGYGPDREADIVEQAVKYGIIKKNGTWLAYGPANIGQGTERTADFLRGDITLRDEIYQKLMLKACPPPSESELEAAASAPEPEVDEDEG